MPGSTRPNLEGLGLNLMGLGLHPGGLGLNPGVLIIGLKQGRLALECTRPKPTMTRPKLGN